MKTIALVVLISVGKLFAENPCDLVFEKKSSRSAYDCKENSDGTFDVKLCFPGLNSTPCRFRGVAVKRDSATCESPIEPTGHLAENISAEKIRNIVRDDVKKKFALDKNIPKTISLVPEKSQFNRSKTWAASTIENKGRAGEKEFLIGLEIQKVEVSFMKDISHDAYYVHLIGKQADQSFTYKSEEILKLFKKNEIRDCMF